MRKVLTTDQFKDKMKIINPDIEVLGEYINTKTNILVKDKKCSHEWNTSAPRELLKGRKCPICTRIRTNKKLIKDKTGEIKTMNNGEVAEIIEYNKNNNMKIKIISTGEIIKCNYSDFTKGKIKSHFSPTVFGIGITGLEVIRDENNKLINSYKCWHSMIARCYNENLRYKHPTYEEAIVCDDWLFYPNFKKWYDENYYVVRNEKMQLDKDILHKGNKIYSRETCIFVPKYINTLLVNRKNYRGKDPLGVYYNKHAEKYTAKCNIFDTTTNKSILKRLGYFNNSESAFNAYKRYKEEHIKKMANYYKECIPIELYIALYNWKIEITD